MSDPDALDPRLVRRSFERAAASFDHAAFLAREIGERMFERLDLLRIAPRRILDLGSGTGHCTRKLQARYTGCRVVQDRKSTRLNSSHRT